MICGNIIVFCQQLDKSGGVEWFGDDPAFGGGVQDQSAEVYQVINRVRYHWEVDFIQIFKRYEHLGRVGLDELQAGNWWRLILDLILFFEVLEVGGFFVVFFRFEEGGGVGLGERGAGRWEGLVVMVQGEGTKGEVVPGLTAFGERTHIYFYIN